MGVRQRLLLWLAGVAIFLLAAVAGFAHWILMPEAFNAELALLQKEMANADNLFTQSLGDVERVTRDYATWDDMIEYVEGRMPGFLESSLAPLAFEALNINFAAILDKSGNLVHAEYLDHVSGEHIRGAGRFAAHIEATGQVFRKAFGGDTVCGPIHEGATAYLVCARPILRSNGEGPPGGVVVMARRFGPEEAVQMGRRLQLDIDLRVLTEQDAARHAMAEIEEQGEAQRVRVESDALRGTRVMNDIYGVPALELEVTITRVILDRVRVVFAFFVLMSLGTFLILGAATTLLMDRYIFSRIALLDKFVRSRETTGELAESMPPQDADEVSRLGNRMDRLITWLQAQVVKSEQAQQQLMASEARLRAIYDCVPFSIMLNRLSDNVCIGVNQRFSDTTGIGLSEAVGRTPLEMNLLEDGMIFERMKERLLREGKIEKLQVNGRDRDGTPNVLLISSVLIPWGDAPSALTISVDITEKERAEQQLRESEEMLRLVIEQTGHMVYELDTATGVNSWRGAVEEILGYTLDDFANVDVYNWSQLIHPDDREEAVRLLDEAIANVGRYAVIYRFKRKDGVYIQVEDIGTVMNRPGADGRWMLGVMRDVSDRIRAEEALRESETRFRTLFEAASDAILLMRDQEFIECNRQAELLFGVAREELIGSSPLDFSPALQPDGQASIDKALARISGAMMGQPQLFSWLHMRRDGVQFDAEVKLNRVELQDGIFIQALVRDVTEQNRYEARLRQAQKMEAIGQLAGGIAHDFNNLLQAIIGYGEMLQVNMGTGGDSALFLEELLAAAERAAGLTRQLLTFGRRQVIDPKPTNINDVVREMMRLLRRLIGEHVELELQLAERLPLIKADRGQLEQILINLCVNARDAMPLGGRILVYTKCIAPEQLAALAIEGKFRSGAEVVQLTVSDTGYGMSPDVLSHIFEPFFTTKEQGKGTGLGLATVHGIMEQHQGCVQVRSAPGLGTTFDLYFVATEEPMTKVVSTASRALPGEGETILLAEDEDRVRQLTRQILERSGYRVIAAANGEEALGLFEQHGAEIDMLLLDVVMPRMGGPALWERIRAVRPDIPCLFASGYSDTIVHEGAVVAEGINLLQKPFMADQLLARVRAILDDADVH